MTLLIVLLLFGGALAQSTNEGSWLSFGGKTYLYIRENVNWANAQSSCIRMGAHHVVFNSRAEEEFVRGLTNGEQFWIGLSDAQQYGSWFWINSDPLGYTNWCPGKPVYKGANKRCAARGRRCWDDQMCSKRLHYICEREEIAD